jgi:hypothetical protein
MTPEGLQAIENARSPLECCGLIADERERPCLNIAKGILSGNQGCQ